MGRQGCGETGLRIISFSSILTIQCHCKNVENSTVPSIKPVLEHGDEKADRKNPVSCTFGDSYEKIARHRSCRKLKNLQSLPRKFFVFGHIRL